LSPTQRLAKVGRFETGSKAQGNTSMTDSILKGKRILAVDDEPDVLDSLEDLLGDYEGLFFDRAVDYTSGFHLLRSWTYDAVILDIMGVDGFKLLNASIHLGFPTVMLTAHALSPQNLKKSVEMGARAFIPKEKMVDMPAFLEDVLSLSHGTSLAKAFNRLGGLFNTKFGSQWMETEKKFWSMVTSGDYSPTPVILKK